MSVVLRILLIVSSIGVLWYVLRRIRKIKIRIEDSIFWITFSFVLVLLGVFPQIAIGLSELLGIQSPVNLVFLTIIFLLIFKLFSLTGKLATLEVKFQTLVQRYAIDQKSAREARKEQSNRDSTSDAQHGTSDS